MTSRRVVDVVQRLARPLGGDSNCRSAKAGHAGTLDPLATGVLVVCVGGATRLIEYVQRMPKRYLGTFLLGRRSPTEDIEGEVVELADAPVPTRDAIQLAARRMVGRIEQRPPSFSALKVQGRPAYRLARRGMPVELTPRPVDIHRIEVMAYDYPELILEIDCGGGTYVRSLGRDLAESLGTAAVMSALTRLSIGDFRLEQSIGLEELTGESWLGFVQPPLRAVEYLPQVRLSAENAVRIQNGLTIEIGGGGRGAGNGRGPEPEVLELVALDPAGELIGILTPLGSGRWRVLRNLPTETHRSMMSPVARG